MGGHFSAPVRRAASRDAASRPQRRTRRRPDRLQRSGGMRSLRKSQITSISSAPGSTTPGRSLAAKGSSSSRRSLITPHRTRSPEGCRSSDSITTKSNTSSFPTPTPITTAAQWFLQDSMQSARLVYGGPDWDAVDKSTNHAGGKPKHDTVDGRRDEVLSGRRFDSDRHDARSYPGDDFVSLRGEGQRQAAAICIRRRHGDPVQRDRRPTTTATSPR